MAGRKIIIEETDEAVAAKLCDLVIDVANSSIKDNGQFTVGLSGGSLIKFLSKGLLNKETDWSKWRIFFCDERHVDFSSPDCTYAQYKQGLFDKIDRIKDENVFPIDPSLSVAECAEDYTKKVRSVFPGTELPKFDMLLLGMGPDGHTCSLFRGHSLLEEKEKIIAPISDSPKPPPSRVTMTFPVVNNCRYAVFASCGASKAEMVQRILEGNESPPLPAARVRPTNGELYWFLDKAARILEGNENPPLPASRVRPTNGELYWFLDKAAAANLKNSS